MTGRHILHSLGMPGSLGARKAARRRLVATDQRKGHGPKATAQGAIDAGHMRWLSTRQHMTVTQVAEYLGLSYSRAHAVLVLGAYANSPATQPPQWKDPT